jgi:Amt family ammonium transporter
MVTAVKSKFKYDDSLDAFGIHGAGGTVGALLTGVFATKLITGDARALGAVDGNPGQIWNQLMGIGIAWGLGIVGTIVILKICDMVTGVRVSPEQEQDGLDLSLHGEEGYNFDA